MGASHAVAVYTYWSHLPHVPFRLLVRMALTCPDRDTEPHYFHGREQMALALGLDASEGNYRNIRRALQQLINAGAIEVLEQGKNGRRSDYRIYPAGRPQQLTGLPFQGGRHDPPKGGRHDPPKGGRHDPPKGGRHDPPKEDLGAHVGTTERNIHALRN